MGTEGNLSNVGRSLMPFANAVEVEASETAAAVIPIPATPISLHLSQEQKDL